MNLSLRRRDSYIYFAIIIFFLIYQIMLMSGGEDAPDRYWYFKLFNDPNVDVRMNRGFGLIVQGVRFFTTDPVTVLLAIGGLVYLTAMMAAWRFANELDLNIYVIFPFLFFGYVSIFSFIQLRAGLVAWGLLCIYLSSLRNSVKLLGCLFLGAIHSMAFGVILLYFSTMVFLKSNNWLRLFWILIVVVVLMHARWLLMYLGVDDYWLKYFEDQYLTKSALPVFYVISFASIGVVLQFKKIAYEIVELWLPWLCLIILVIASYTRMSIYVKMAAPFFMLNMGASIYSIAKVVGWKMRGGWVFLTFLFWGVVIGYSVSKYA